MNCLSCNASLVTAELRDVEVDYCSQCGGIWLDKGELECLLQSTEAAQHYLRSFTPDPQSKEKPRKCPICRKKMGKILCGKPGVRIDKCPSEHGLWCDKGELQCILEKADAGNPQVIQYLQELFAPKNQKNQGGAS